MLDPTDQFGDAVAALGDIDCDGLGDIGVGAYGDDEGGSGQGAVWILSLNANGTVASQRRIAEGAEGFGGTLDPSDFFGTVAGIGDIDGDGSGDLAVGAHGDDDGGADQGAVWILFLAGDATAPSLLCPTQVRVIDRKNSPPGEFVFFTVSAVDDFDESPTVACVPPSGSYFPRGVTMVTCTATDACGNQSVCTFPVLVRGHIRRR